MNTTTASQMLFDEPPLLVRPRLAATIGLNEAIVLQQIHYWITEKEKRKEARYFIDGRWWCYNTIREWHQTFYFWSSNTVERTLKSLRDQGLVIAAHLSRKRADRTLWYTIDYGALACLELKERPQFKEPTSQSQDDEEPFPQNGEMVPPKWGNENPKMGKSIIPPKWGNDLTKNKNTNKEIAQRVSRGRNAPKSNGEAEAVSEADPEQRELVAAVTAVMNYWSQLTGRRAPRRDDLLRDEWMMPINELLSRVQWDIERAEELLRDTRQEMLSRDRTPLRPLAIVPIILGKLDAAAAPANGNGNGLYTIPNPKAAADNGPVIWSQ